MRHVLAVILDQSGGHVPEVRTSGRVVGERQLSKESQAGDPSGTVTQAEAPVAGWYNTEQCMQEHNEKSLELAWIESVRGISAIHPSPAVVSQLNMPTSLRPRPPVAPATTQQPSGPVKEQHQKSSAMLMYPTVPVSANLQAVFGTLIATALTPAVLLKSPDRDVRVHVSVTTGSTSGGQGPRVTTPVNNSTIGKNPQRPGRDNPAFSTLGQDPGRATTFNRLGHEAGLRRIVNGRIRPL